MSNDVLDKVKSLPKEQQQEVEDFIDYLLSKYLNESSKTISDAQKSEILQRDKDFSEGKMQSLPWEAIQKKYE